MSKTFKDRCRMILIFIFAGPTILGDINIKYIPKFILYPWIWVISVWQYLPVVISRKTYDELIDGNDMKELLEEMYKAHIEQVREKDSIISEIEYDLRQIGRLDIFREVQERVAQDDWGHKTYYWKSDEDKDPDLTIS